MRNVLVHVFRCGLSNRLGCSNSGSPRLGQSDARHLSGSRAIGVGIVIGAGMKPCTVDCRQGCQPECQRPKTLPTPKRRSLPAILPAAARCQAIPKAVIEKGRDGNCDVANGLVLAVLAALGLFLLAIIFNVPWLPQGGQSISATVKNCFAPAPRGDVTQ